MFSMHEFNNKVTDNKLFEIKYRKKRTLTWISFPRRRGMNRHTLGERNKWMSERRSVGKDVIAYFGTVSVTD